MENKAPRKRMSLMKSVRDGNLVFDKRTEDEKLNQEALDYHQYPKPGKFEVVSFKPMETAQDLALAYSPGVAQPCLDIAKDPENAYRFTGKGNLCACVTNGTAVLGLGNIGALAGKPVMEGKSVLFKHFAGVECVDICVDESDPDKFIDCVKRLHPTFGGINLEDIKGPECFYIEEELKRLMPIPVFHDDQHGTAIVCLAGFINACDISGKDPKTVKIVCNGAGAAGIACTKLLISYGADPNNVFVCDTRGVIYPQRQFGMNPFKKTLANSSIHQDTTLEEICKEADVLIGVSAPRIFTKQILMNLAKDPIIFAMANPEPEVRPELAKEWRPDCIIATGRSDYPNQINNVMCFPYLFRATLDTRSKQINEAMKMAAAKALARLAREEVPQVVKDAIKGRDFTYGREYVIPTPFDPRLLTTLPIEVAKAAMESGTATKPIDDLEKYRESLTRIDTM